MCVFFFRFFFWHLMILPFVLFDLLSGYDVVLRKCILYISYVKYSFCLSGYYYSVSFYSSLLGKVFTGNGPAVVIFFCPVCNAGSVIRNLWCHTVVMIVMW
jgi:hypothetical protein